MPDLRFTPVDLDSPLFAAWRRTQAAVFLGPYPDEEAVERRRRVADRAARRTAALDGDAVVATFVSWDTRVSAPGGAAVAADAVSGVTVLPTHRRRGILTRMIVPDLADAAGRGVPVAVLIAAEAPIYGRFGFGAATETARWSVDVRAATLAAGVPLEGTVEVVPEAGMRALAPPVFEAARRPGAIDQHETWWDRGFGLAGEPDHKQRTWLVHRDRAGRPDGYAGFRPEESWVDRVNRTVAHVGPFQAVTPAAYAGLWSVLTSLDLVARLDAEELAVDEALPWLLTDARAARQAARSDFQWSRLLDPAAALSARTYEGPGTTVLRVLDPHGWAAGTYALEADADGTGACTRTTAEAQVTLPVDVLSSLWLGGGDLGAAAIAGRAEEHRPGAIARLARLLRTSRAPWTPTWF
ncbi:MAG TPA: GNAT family N-acetyltransferase [Kineosporiaceae bacterium]|nr:GNAT family N-acetyltransferase [Kineosporiaceae bacterium]